MALRLAPTTARQARLLRVANSLARKQTPGAPTSEADKLLWVRSHARLEADQRFSKLEEAERMKMLPTTTGTNNPATHGTSTTGENLFHFREYPMYPGEYVPPEHNTLASVRDNLRADLSAQSIKDAWMRVSGGRFYSTTQEFYDANDGLGEEQLGDVVHALFPDLSSSEAQGLVRRIMEAMTAPTTSAARSIAGTVTADALGLDEAPQHYTNFLQWMSRMTATKAFATEMSIHQFCRRAFNKRDVHTMYNNFVTVSPDAMRRLSADGYSHFYAVLRDYSIKLAGNDTRHQIGVRIDPMEVDPKTGFAFGFGRFNEIDFVCMLRANRNGTGRMAVHGKPIAEYFGDSPKLLETILAPMDEAGLDYKDWDVYFLHTMDRGNDPSDRRQHARACELALARAITHAVPLARIPLKKAGYLSFDRTKAPGDFVGFLDQKMHRRRFVKRAAKGIK